MKLSIAKEQFASGLQSVQNIVTSRTTLPILSNVLLRAEEKRLELTATDLDVTIQCEVPAEVSKPGDATLPVKKLFSIVRELGAPELDLEVNDKAICSLTAGPSFFKLHGLSAEEFPPVPEFQETRVVSLPQEKLRSMLRKTSFAVSNDESRYVLNGIFFNLKDHKLTLVATDGRRLALTDEEVEMEPEQSRDFIVPTKAVQELARLLQDKGEVEIQVSENQVAFTLRGEDGRRAVLIT
jgi:DNA polymerase-3 subunit beta